MLRGLRGERRPLSVGQLWGSGTSAWRNPPAHSPGWERDGAEVFGAGAGDCAWGLLGARFSGCQIFWVPGFLGTRFSRCQVFRAWLSEQPAHPVFPSATVAEGQHTRLHDGPDATFAVQYETWGFTF